MLGQAVAQDHHVGHPVASGLVEATERLYRSLFTCALGYALATAAWGVVLAPFNEYLPHHWRSAGLCGLWTLFAACGLVRRTQLFHLLRARPALHVLLATLGVLTLWADSTWHSTAYLVSYSAIMIAAVTGGVRWAVPCGVIGGAGYAAGTLLSGQPWADPSEVVDTSQVLANVGGYVLAGVFFALPVEWLGRYVARINQVLTRTAEGARDRDRPAGGAPRVDSTAGLSAREIEVVQLLTEGMTNDAIAQRLVLSPRTVQSHVASAMRKTGTGSRTQLAVVALREGLAPLQPSGAER